MKNRRILLRCLPLAAGLAPLGAAAFRAEPATPAILAAYGACPAPADHAGLQASLDAAVDGRAIPPELTAAVRCPYCGCDLAGAPDHGEQPPPEG